MVTGLSASAVHVGDAALKSSDICPSKITIPGKRAPLDFTLKTSLQFVSSSSVKWWVCTGFSFISFVSRIHLLEIVLLINLVSIFLKPVTYAQLVF